MKKAIMQMILSNGIMVNLFYCHIILYWEKVNSYEKCSHNTLEVQILKHFTGPKQQLTKLFSPTPDKNFLRLRNKNFLTELYTNIQTFAFQVLGERSSWASRTGAVQMFAGKFVKWVTLLAALQEYIFYNVAS